jgi:sterol desaturase/sphingolipid hydroxylase (fatty acid hydroxylase superfamily)
MFEAKSLAAPLALAAFWLAESWAPFYPHFRGGLGERLRHDGRNLVAGAVNAAALALLFGGAFAAQDAWASGRGIGLLRALSWPVWAETAAALVVFDLWMYLWHRANHRLPFLWRFHRMHHSDTELDATTAVRFHTGEILLSACARLLVVPALGMELWQLVLYETLLLPVIVLHHSNVRLWRPVDHWLLALIVTPAMHRVHHSRLRPETDSNYGSILPWWDLLLRTFRLRQDARTVPLGLEEFDSPRWLGLRGMLLTPLARQGRREEPPPGAGAPPPAAPACAEARHPLQ